MKTIKVNFSDLPKSTKDTPIFDYCRKLIAEGVDPKTRLEVYRNPAHWDLAITEIGIGAKLTVKEDPNIHFALYKPMPDDLKARLSKNKANKRDRVKRT